MTRGDKDKLFICFVALFTLSLFSKIVCSLWSKHRLPADAIKCGYHSNDTSADPNMVVFVYPPW